MDPKISIENITFSDGSTFQFQPDDIVIIVGPNNSGKSAALRGIHAKVGDASQNNQVVSNVGVRREGTVSELLSWLQRTTRSTNSISPENNHFEALGQSVHVSNARSYWQKQGLGGLTRFFCHLLTAEERLQAANQVGAIALLDQAPIHPIHYLQLNESLETKLSDNFRKAFGSDLIVFRNGGGVVPLLCGNRPSYVSGEDRLSISYQEKLSRLPKIQSQGDGMRSFVGVLLYTSVGNENIVLIDEPEAFLHPPQARLLGRMLVKDKPNNRQLFLATHSGDFLRGILDVSSKNVRVMRVRRENDINTVKQLENAKIEALWSDPLLRYSNVLDGVFHEQVVVVESDSDARFYGAIMDALYDGATIPERKPDVMFVHGGGKARIPMIVKSLKELGVPVRAIVDFDILNDEKPLCDVVAALDGDWAALKGDWALVNKTIDSIRPHLNSSDVNKSIQDILKKVDAPVFPVQAKSDIEQVLKQSSAWSVAKTTGKSFVPNGDPFRACDRLLTSLNAQGIFVVEVGEVEGFARTVGKHGPAWVNEVLKKDLRNDIDLQVARDFVRRIIT